MSSKWRPSSEFVVAEDPNETMLDNKEILVDLKVTSEGSLKGRFVLIQKKYVFQFKGEYLIEVHLIIATRDADE